MFAEFRGEACAGSTPPLNMPLFHVSEDEIRPKPITLKSIIWERFVEKVGFEPGVKE